MCQGGIIFILILKGYVSQEGSSSCTMCPASKYSYPGSSSCIDCGRGMNSLPGSSRCSFINSTASFYDEIQNKYYNYSEMASSLLNYQINFNNEAYFLNLALNPTSRCGKDSFFCYINNGKVVSLADSISHNVNNNNLNLLLTNQGNQNSTFIAFTCTETGRFRPFTDLTFLGKRDQFIIINVKATYGVN
jgi:hypothetical protein